MVKDLGHLSHCVYVWCVIVSGKKKAEIAAEKGAGVIPLFGGLFSRIFIASLLMAVLTIALVISVFGLYLDRQSTSQAEERLTRSIAILAPVIDGAVMSGNISSARQILVNLVEEQGVVCVDYSAPSMIEDALPFSIGLPNGGCHALGQDSQSFHSVSLMSSSAGAYRFLIDDRYFVDDRNQQLFVTGITVAGSLLMIFTLLSIVFQRLILSPLRNLQEAMISSRPSKPALATIMRNDEIGAVSRTYNKLAAASRIYFARLQNTQKGLRESETKFKDMAEISGDWFYEMDADLRFTYISDRFFDISGLVPADVIGKTRPQMMLDRALTNAEQAHLDDLAARRPFKSFEYQLNNQSAEPLILAINGKPLCDDDGAFIGYRGTGSDVSAITRDRKLLEDTNRNFGESVSYASAIQRGLLPSQSAVESQFGEVSVIWQPKDLVGGDFYWVGQIGGARYLVFFDCTGHGVPGAFMTLITSSVLEKISAASPFALGAPQMLEQIHQGVCDQLGISLESPGKDGLDCAVIKMDISEGQLEFSGASVDLFVIDKTSAVTRLRGARHCLGYQIFAEARAFDAHRVALAGNSFVLVTDGLATQIGQTSKRVLGTRRIIEALEAAGDQKPSKLLRALGMLLKRWQGAEERRDDVTMLAFRPDN